MFSDGNVVGAALDRNGLRPARYMITSNSDGQKHVHVMSEVGVTKALEQFANQAEAGQTDMAIVQSGRLGPGD